MQPLILVDMMNLVFRMHWSHQHLHNAEDKPTGVQYGVLSAVARLRREVSRRMIFCWDHGVPVLGAPKPANWRDEFLSKYKAGRTHDEDVRKAIFGQLPALFNVLCDLGYSSVSFMGLEADDVIGILARECKGDVLIMSNDMDFYQLLDNRVQILVPKKDQGVFRRITATEIEMEYDVRVDRWAEFLALGGDKSDNIKPMRGMGPVTAQKLIASGVDLTKSLHMQPLRFQQKYSGAWPDILNSFSAARLPVSRKDPRVRTLIPPTFRIPAGNQRWPDEQTRTLARIRFERFCADHDMTTIMAVRHQLFDTGEQLPCPITVNAPAQAPQKTRPRSLFV